MPARVGRRSRRVSTRTATASSARSVACRGGASYLRGGEATFRRASFPQPRGGSHEGRAVRAPRRLRLAGRQGGLRPPRRPRGGAHDHACAGRAFRTEREEDEAPEALIRSCRCRTSRATCTTPRASPRCMRISSAQPLRRSSLVPPVVTRYDTAMARSHATRPLTAAERMRRYRARRHEAGLRAVTRWTSGEPRWSDAARMERAPRPAVGGSAGARHRAQRGRGASPPVFAARRATLRRRASARA